MYKPHRDERFHDLWQLMNFIEDNQCSVCRYRKSPKDFGIEHAEEYPMCTEIESLIMTEEPCPVLDDKGVAGVVCNVFRLGGIPEPEDPDQLLLGE